MAKMDAGGFPVTRRTLDQLDDWYAPLADPFLPLQIVPAPQPRADRFFVKF